jgi:hypothetical protein
LSFCHIAQKELEKGHFSDPKKLDFNTKTRGGPNTAPRTRRQKEYFVPLLFQNLTNSVTNASKLSHSSEFSPIFFKTRRQKGYFVPLFLSCVTLLCHFFFKTVTK